MKHSNYFFIFIIAVFFYEKADAYLLTMMDNIY